MCDNIKYFNNLLKPIHLFFKGGTYFTYILPILGSSATYFKIKAFYIYFLIFFKSIINKYSNQIDSGQEKYIILIFL